MNTDRAWAKITSQPGWHKRAMVLVADELLREAGDAIDMLMEMDKEGVDEDTKARTEAWGQRRTEAANMLVAIVEDDQRAVEELLLEPPPRPDEEP